MKKKVLFVVLGISVLTGAYLLLDRMLFDGIRPQYLDEKGLQGAYYAGGNPEKGAAVVLIGGGVWGDYWAQYFAKAGFAGLSLPYTGADGLPPLPEEIPLEYIEQAVQWLAAQPAVEPTKIILMGASRNAELALLAAAYFPDKVSGAIAYAPSVVSWSNTVLPYNSDTVKASWTFRGTPVPYIPMPKLGGTEGDTIHTLSYWRKGLARIDAVARAGIPVEHIKGPVLLLSGKDDAVWPAAEMADMLENRLRAYAFPYAIENIQYEQAGHLISRHPDVRDEVRTGTMNLNGEPYTFYFGGTIEGDFNAKQDAKRRIMDFLRRL